MLDPNISSTCTRMLRQLFPECLKQNQDAVIRVPMAPMEGDARSMVELEMDEMITHTETLEQSSLLVFRPAQMVVSVAAIVRTQSHSTDAHTQVSRGVDDLAEAPKHIDLLGIWGSCSG